MFESESHHKIINCIFYDENNPIEISESDSLTITNSEFNNIINDFQYSDSCHNFTLHIEPYCCRNINNCSKK